MSPSTFEKKYKFGLEMGCICRGGRKRKTACLSRNLNQNADKGGADKKREVIRKKNPGKGELMLKSLLDIRIVL